MPSSTSSQYAASVAAGRVERDQAQLAVIGMMTRLEQRIVEFRLARKSSALGWLFAGRERALPPIKGLYIYGDVGRGKTMLMDLFFEASPVERKRRAHFHEFMLDVHERIHAFRQGIKQGERADEDPIRVERGELAGRHWLLCFGVLHGTGVR